MLNITAFKTSLLLQYTNLRLGWGGGCVAIWRSLTKMPTQSQEIELNK